MYKNSKIYKIVNDIEPMTYYGSTTNFDQRVKEKNIEVKQGNDFLNDFTKESLIKALNTIADADKKSPGSTKFNDLQIMQGDMNTDVA